MPHARFADTVLVTLNQESNNVVWTVMTH